MKRGTKFIAISLLIVIVMLLLTACAARPQWMGMGGTGRQ
jgi:hypothetical protein